MRRLFMTAMILSSLQTATITCLSQANDTTMLSTRQQGDKYLSLLLGYNLWKNHFVEVGIAINQLDIVGPHPLGVTYFISNEIRVFDEPLVGPKIGIWFGGGASALAMGVNAIYYTDFKNGTMTFRPEIGFGLDRFKLVYGYNIRITNSNVDRINKSNISIVALLSLVKVRKGTF